MLYGIIITGNLGHSLFFQFNGVAGNIHVSEFLRVSKLFSSDKNPRSEIA